MKRLIDVAKDTLQSEGVGQRSDLAIKSLLGSEGEGFQNLEDGIKRECESVYDDERERVSDQDSK